MAPSMEDIQLRLAASREELFQRYPIRSLAIFGSYARGDAQPGSDVDILVEFSEPVGLEIVDLAEELEARLECDVDLVSRGAVTSRLMPHIEKHMIHV